MLDKITSFSGEYHFLSNFWYSQIITPDGRAWQTVEHFYQAMKTADLKEQENIRVLSTPGQAKRAGRRVITRPQWDKIKVNVMREGLKLKFTIPEMKKLLLGTGNTHLEEGNKWGDTFWGTTNGVGKNWLGKLLMEVRECLTEEMNK